MNWLKKKCCCGTPALPNSTCLCPPGNEGGLTACDGITQFWPVSGTISVSGHSNTWQDVASLNGDVGIGGFTPSGFGGFPGFDDEADFSANAANFGYILVNNTISVLGGSATVGDDCSNGCHVGAQGYYLKANDQLGASYEFDAMGGLPSLKWELSLATSVNPPPSGDGTSWAFDGLSPMSLEERLSFVGAGPDGGTGVTLAVHGGHAFASYTVTPASGPAKTLTKIDFNNYISSLALATSVTSASGGTLPDTGSVVSVCLGSISSHSDSSTPTSTHANWPDRFRRSSDIYDNLISTPTASVSSSTPPGNPGGQDCPRWVHIVLTRDNDGAVLVDVIAPQACSPANPGPGSVEGWLYSAAWGPLERAGPTLWTLNGGDRYYRVKGDGSCCPSSGQVCADIAWTNTGTSNTFDPQLYDGDWQLALTTYTLSVSEAGPLYCHECGCDEPCDPCEHCNAAPSSMVLHIVCQHYDFELEENVVTIDITIVMVRTSTSPCAYEGTSEDSAHTAWLSKDGADGYRIDLTANDGSGSLALHADCSRFDMMGMSWSLTDYDGDLDPTDCGEDGLQVTLE